MPPAIQGAERCLVRNGWTGGGSSPAGPSDSAASRSSWRRSREIRRARATDHPRAIAASASPSMSRTIPDSRIGRTPIRLLEQVHRHGNVLVAKLIRQSRDDAGGDVLAEDRSSLPPMPLEAEQLLDQWRVSLQPGDLGEAGHAPDAVLIALDVDQ